MFTQKNQEPEALDIFTLIIGRYMDSMELDSRVSFTKKILMNHIGFTLNFQIFQKYTEVVACLHPRSIDGLTSPTTWWEVPVGKLKKATVIRCYLALNNRILDNPLSWLDPIVDVFVGQKGEHTFLFQHLAATLYAFKSDNHAYDWIMDLFRQIQILLADSGNQTNNEKISFLVDVCVVSIVAFSGYIVILEEFTAIASARNTRIMVFPQSVNLLLERAFWKSNEAKVCANFNFELMFLILLFQVLDIFYAMYKNNSIPECYSNMFKNAITCLRNKPCFESKNIWTKYVGMRK